MKKNIARQGSILLFVFSFSLASVFAAGLPMAKNGELPESWVKGRQMVSINLVPALNSWIIPGVANSIINNPKGTLGKLPIPGIEDTMRYFGLLQSKNVGYGGIMVSYSFFFTDRVSPEFGIGVYGSKYQLGSTRAGLIDFMNANPDLASGLGGAVEDIIATDTYLSAKYTFLPIHLGVRLYGKKRIFFNSFRLGVTTIFYDVRTQNGISGVKTEQRVTDTTFYVAYEMGWKIELFPTRDWPVKPAIEFSLLEIGYHFKGWAKPFMDTLVGGTSAMGSGLGLGNLLPKWDAINEMTGGLAGPLSNIRLIFFPRIGFSIRF